LPELRNETPRRRAVLDAGKVWIFASIHSIHLHNINFCFSSDPMAAA
jgi:hypothetical protein